MGLFWIFGGSLPFGGGGHDFLASVHSLDEARAWVAANPQEWYGIWVWREGRLEFEEGSLKEEGGEIQSETRKSRKSVSH